MQSQLVVCHSKDRQPPLRLVVPQNVRNKERIRAKMTVPLLFDNWKESCVVDFGFCMQEIENSYAIGF